MSTRIPQAYLLGFATTRTPTSINILYERYPIDIYYPPPIRCYNCQRYGHKAPCKRPAVCPKCAQPITETHKESNCTNNTQCAACKSDEHDVRSKACPKYREEQNIIRISKNEQVPILEARQTVKNVGKLTGTRSYVIAASQNTPENFPALSVHSSNQSQTQHQSPNQQETNNNLVPTQTKNKK